jgi:anti-anti-sigma factor
MDITQRRDADTVELRISGRLDAYWADHLGAALDEAIRGGAERIRLDMAAVSFMSSVGIRALLKAYKQVQRLDGSFAVVRPSEAVRSVLQLAGLEMLLTGAEEPVQPTARESGSRIVEHGGVRLELHDLAVSARLRATVLGDARVLGGGVPAPAVGHTVRVSRSLLAVGLGGFGGDLEDCRKRFGELLAVGGGAAYLPTDGTNVADSLVGTGSFVPELQVLYGIECEGSFAHLARFEAGADGPLDLSRLVEACLQGAGCAAAGIAIAAESAGLLGVSLRRSPAAEGFAFELPGVRDWLSFTPERVFARSLALVVGVAANGDAGALAPLLRPLAPGTSLAGHFHAAAFSYRPLRRGALDLCETVSSLFEAETLQGVLHLLHDDRDIVGGGESQLVRGACWIGPIGETAPESA